MSLSITQTPATCSLAQSPTIFTLSESGGVVSSASFQYYADLYYWSGTTAQSSSIPEYQLVKYPNASGVGIFDVSKIINSTLQDTREENPSNVKYFKIDGYFVHEGKGSSTKYGPRRYSEYAADDPELGMYINEFILGQMDKKVEELVKPLDFVLKQFAKK